MRRCLGLFVLLSLTQTNATLAQATPEIRPGDRVRVTSTECPLPDRQTVFRGIGGDSLLFRVGGENRACPLHTVGLLEVYQGRRRWSSGARVGAIAGGTAGALVFLSWDPGPFVGLGAGAMIGAGIGGGPRGRKSLLIGAGIGAGGGALVGPSVCEGDESQSLCALFSGAIGAVAGAALGSLIGLILGEDRWEEALLPPVQSFVKRFPDGRTGLGLSIPMRR